MSRHFPLFADLNNRPVLLVGAGHVAARKAEDLLRAGARLRVVARELSPVFQDWLAAGHHIPRRGICTGADRRRLSRRRRHQR